MKRFLLIIWQLPQLIVSAIIYMFIDVKDFKLIDNKAVIFSDRMRGGLCLGELIIISTRIGACKLEKTLRHELGHSRQSEILGWFYLLVIGLPSLLHAIYHAIFRYGDYKGYYKFYTERWADKLGGVER